MFKSSESHISHIFPIFWFIKATGKEQSGIYFVSPDPEGCLVEIVLFRLANRKLHWERGRKHRSIFYWTQWIISVYCHFMDVRHKHLHYRSYAC